MADDTANVGGESEAGGEELATLKSQVEEMKGEIGKKEEANKELDKKLQSADAALMSPEYLAYLEGQRKGGEEGEDKGEEAAGGEQDVDFDTMTNAQMAAHLTQQNASALKELRVEVEKGRTSLEEAMAQAVALNDLEMTRIRHPDLVDKMKDESYFKEFYTVAQSNPAWHAEQVYGQVEMVRKVADEQRQAADLKKAEEADKAAMGEKGGVPSSTVAPKDLSDEEAATLAYRKAYGSNPPAVE